MQSEHTDLNLTVKRFESKKKLETAIVGKADDAKEKMMLLEAPAGIIAGRYRLEFKNCLFTKCNVIRHKRQQKRKICRLWNEDPRTRNGLSMAYGRCKNCAGFRWDSMTEPNFNDALHSRTIC